jgi:hypothetical protein
MLLLADTHSASIAALAWLVGNAGAEAKLIAGKAGKLVGWHGWRGIRPSRVVIRLDIGQSAYLTPPEGPILPR